jgi:hypothetical protein
MRARLLRVPLIAAGLAAGCGSSPSAPSTGMLPGSLSPAVTQGIVAATLTQATNVVISAAPDGSSKSLIFTCPGGGTMTMTINVATPAGPSGSVSMSTRMEVSDCRSDMVTMNGDPYVTMASDYVFVRGADGLATSMTGTMRMTGGLRFDVGATQGRARYDCTLVTSMQLGTGTPSQPSVSSSGTITWEQPLGSVTVGPCGP